MMGALRRYLRTPTEPGHEQVAVMEAFHLTWPSAVVQRGSAQAGP
jgi:hypothetical protein